MTLMTAMTMNCRGFLKGVRHSPEMDDGREHEEHECDKERCPCEARSAYLFPNISCCSSGLQSRSALGGPYSRGTSS
jgi:hypothetical protein